MKSQTITDKEARVLSYLLTNDPFNRGFHYSKFIELIFEKDIVHMYSYHKLLIMTKTYLGKMCKKDLIAAEYSSSCGYMGHYLRPKGKQQLEKISKKIK